MNRQALRTLLFVWAFDCTVGDRPSASAPADSPPAPPAVALEPQEAVPGASINRKGSHVVRRDGAGHLLWSTQLDGYLGGVRPPHLLSDADRVYVTHGEGVTALDWGQGKVLWHTKGPANGLFLDGNLLLATGGGWLVARSTATGAESFRVRLLPAEDFDPEPVRKVAGLFVVQEWFTRNDTHAFLIDRRGQVRLRLRRLVVDGLLQGNDQVLLTNEDVARFSPDDKLIWSVPFDGGPVVPGGELRRLPDGDLIAFRYGRISDSGMQVLRLAPGTGELRWRARCPALGIGHLTYYHKAEVTLEGERLKVDSRGAEGNFVEVLDLRSGKRLSRD